MPGYLRSIGFTALGIGFLEGLCEATAGLSKSWFGHWSDRMGRRAPFVQAGYSLSALSKPLLAASSLPVWVFLCRTVDRLGKGLRTGARDAMLKQESREQTAGRVFGFHRSLDTVGALLGPCVALVFMHLYPLSYHALFLIALVPGIFAVAFTFFLREKRITVARATSKFSFGIFYKYWQTAPPAFKRLAYPLLFFSVFNSSDLFLLLKAGASDINETYVIGLYILYNLVYAAAAYPAGVLADKAGFKVMLLAGLCFFALAYIIFAFSTGLPALAVAFVLYGLYAACSEGISKAWLAGMVPLQEVATALGTFNAGQSIAALLASSITGIVWFTLGAPVALSLCAMAASVTASVIFKFAQQPTSQ